MQSLRKKPKGSICLRRPINKSSTFPQERMWTGTCKEHNVFETGTHNGVHQRLGRHRKEFHK